MLAVGDKVMVLKDEGYDLPDEVQGKPAVVTAVISKSECMIRTDDGYEAQAAFYHVASYLRYGQRVRIADDLQVPDRMRGQQGVVHYHAYGSLTAAVTLVGEGPDKIAHLPLQLIN